MKKIINSRWFAIADLACVGASLVTAINKPQLGWWLLLPALLPWLFRLAARQFPLHQESLNLPYILFLLTAAVGLWAAAQPQPALMKFWLISLAILLYLAIANQPESNQWLMAGFIVLLGIFLTIVYWLYNDWALLPSRIYLFNQLLLQWQEARPVLLKFSLPTNATVGILAMTVPFMAALGVQSWRKRHFIVVAASLIISVLFTLTLLAGASRGTLLAFSAIVVASLVWYLTGFFVKKLHLSQKLILGITGAIIGFLIFGLFITGPASANYLLNAILGQSQAINHIDLAHSALGLIGDYPFTGSGLNSFAGQYSHYVLVTHNFIVNNSHNLFLNSALEQGLLGMLALVWILLGSTWILITGEAKRKGSLLFYSTLAALLIMILQGLFDDFFYEGPFTVLLFWLPGMVVAISKTSERTKAISAWGKRLTFVAAGSIVLILSLYFKNPLQAAWLANQGAVQMSKVELADFPTMGWKEAPNSAVFYTAERLFWNSIDRDPTNRTSHHRLGLIAMLRGDYSTAIQQLEMAYKADPGNRGIVKSLGFNYVWNGQIDQAIPLLAAIPEAGVELYNYPLWWRNHGREDLAKYAEIAFQDWNAMSPTPYNP